MYSQLSRSTRNKWNNFFESFLLQYCGRGVSAGSQYYHAYKRSNETPLESLYRLNIAGMRSKVNAKDGNICYRREHVEHYIETLDDRDLVKN